MSLRLPLDQRRREIIRKFLAGEPLEEREFSILYDIRRRLAKTDLDLVEADLELLKKFKAKPLRVEIAEP